MSLKTKSDFQKSGQFFLFKYTTLQQIIILQIIPIFNSENEFSELNIINRGI